MTLVRLKTWKAHARLHVGDPVGRPLCGGGNGAKTSHYQVDAINAPNCKACKAISDRRAKQTQGVMPI